MFTMGNAIVLGVVVVILVVYRQLDMNNRSLEKVRRYSDRARDELDKVVAQKATEIRDMAVEVDVHQKSAVEVLKRLSASEQELSSRSDQFEGFARRIQEYDSALHELLEMTKRAEENIGRVRDESEYIDKVGKRIKNTAGQLEHLEKRIPGLVAEFAETNQGQLDTVRNELIQHTQQQLNDFSSVVSGLQERAAAADEHVSAVEARGEQLSQDVQASIRDIYEQLTYEAEQLSERSLQCFTRDLDQKLQQSGAEVETMDSHAKAIVRTAADRVTELKNQAEDSMEAIFHRLRESEAAYEQRLQEIAERGERMETSALEKLREHIQSNAKVLQEEIQSSAKGSQAAVAENSELVHAELDEFRRIIAERQVEMQGSCDEFIHGLQSAYQRDANGVSERIEKLETGIQTAEQEAVRYSQYLEQELERIAAEGQNHIEQAFSSLSEQLDSNRDAFADQLQNGEERSRTELESLLTRLTQDVDAQTQSLQAGMDQRIAQLQQTTNDQHERIEGMFAGLKTEVEEWIDGTRTYISELDNQENQLKDRILQLEEHITATDGQVKEQLRHVTERLDQERLVFTEQVEQLGHTVLSRLAEVQQRGEGNISSLQNDLQTAVQQVRQESLEQLHSSAADMEEQLQEWQQRISQSRQTGENSLQEFSEQFSTRLADLEKTAQQEQQRVESSVSEKLISLAGDVERRNNESLEHLTDHIQKESVRFEQKMITGLEARIGETEEAVRVRVDRIHALADDVDQLETQLRSEIQRSAQRLQGEVESIGNDILARREADLQAAGADMQAIRTDMRSLEQGLDALKEQAYDSVNARLKIFEDDFFADLRTRSESMEQQLHDWQQTVATSLENYKLEQADERQRVEQGYSDNLKQQVAELQQRASQQYQKMSEQIVDTENALQKKIQGAESSVAEFQDQLQAELQELRQLSVEQMTQELRGRDDTIAAQLREFEKSLQTDMRTVVENTHSNQDQLRTMIESTRSDVTLWQTEVLQKLTSAEKDMDSDIAGFKLEVGNTIASVQDDFARQRDELIVQTEQERGALQEQMQRLSAQTRELEDRLSGEIQRALDTFADRYQQYQGDFKSSMKEREEVIEARIREFRGLAQETREQFDSMEEKLFGKLEDRANLLGLNVSEIEKRQKAFIDQTKIFERADSLKLSLQESIEELKSDLLRVENQRKELREMETQFQRLRKLGDEALEKMGRFSQEKRRLDQLEQDYQELIRLSQTVDGQVQTLQDSHDTMQAMQMKLRSLEELQTSVDDRFQRMQVKQEVITSTSNAIDDSFQRVQQIETRLTGFDQEVADLPAKIDGVMEMIAEIQREKPQVDKTVNQVGNLDSVLADVEQRMQQLQKAREWLARTETRFDEINRAADEQLRILGGLLKEQPGGAGDGSREAPSVQARDTVIKLSRNGWQVDEIAKATKLSPGEVELILEIAHK